MSFALILLLVLWGVLICVLLTCLGLVMANGPQLLIISLWGAVACFGLFVLIVMPYHAGSIHVYTEDFPVASLKRGLVYENLATIKQGDEFYSLIRKKDDNVILSYRFTDEPPACFVMRDDGQGSFFEQQC